MEKFNPSIVNLINSIERSAKHSQDLYIKYKLEKNEDLASYYEGMANGYRECTKQVFMFGEYTK